jgi:hypothetical protein
MIIVKGIKCLICGDEIFSRANHDYHSCYCGNISVDGGPQLYSDLETNDVNRGGRSMAYHTTCMEPIDIQLDLSSISLAEISKILFEDWNFRREKYGVIRDNTFSDEARIAVKAKITLLK